MSGGTNVADLSPLADFAAPQTVDVSNTQVSDLSPLITLINRGSPVRWDLTRETNGIPVGKLTNPPPEIVN